MISTAIVVPMASVRRPVLSGPNSIQPAKVSAANARTAGTNHAETWSTSCCIGTLAPWASETSRTICASLVSCPIALVRSTIEPVRLSVAPATRSPAVFSTSRLSPVSMLSSTVVAPSVTTPSTGTLSPGRTRTRSPTTTSETATSSSMTSPSPLSRSTRVVAGWSPTSAVIAAVARRLARPSSHRPSRARATMTSDVSK